MFKITLRTIFIMLVLLSVGITRANAQSAGVLFGLGTATDSSNGQTLDEFGDVGPKMTGLFATFAGDVMFRQSLRLERNIRFCTSQSNYAPQAGVNYRPVFYDFNDLSIHFRKARASCRSSRADWAGADLKSSTQIRRSVLTGSAPR